MPNLIGYTANVAKSIMYATGNYISENMSNVKDFKETNSELFRSAYTSIVNYKQTYKRIMNTSTNSQVYDAGNQLLKSLKEDLKNGTFYNTKRLDQITAEQVGSFGNEDFGDFGDMDFNFDIEDEEPKSKGSKLISSAIVSSSQENTNALGNIMVKSAEYGAQVSRENTNLLYIQSINNYNGISKHLGVINQNIGSILPVVDITKTMMENQAKYYEETTKLLQDQTALLREISTNMKELVPSKKPESRRNSTYNDIAMGGIPDIKAYFNKVKENISNNPDLGFLSSTMNAMGDDTNILKMMAANPLGMVMEGIIGKVLIGKNLKKSMERFDRTMGTMFASMTAKLNGFTDNERSDNPFRDYMNDFLKMFSADTGLKKTVSPGKYYKGDMRWNGTAQKALTDVIPQQLSKIISLLSGLPGQIFDYEQGVFKNQNDVKKEFNSLNKGYSEGATRDIEMEMKSMSKYINMSYDEQQSLFKDMKNMLNTLYEKGILFEYNNKKLDHTYYNIQDSDNYEMLKALFKNTSKETQKQLSQNIMYNRASQKSYLEDLENQGNSIYSSLQNNLFGKNDFLLDSRGNIKKNSSLLVKNSPLNIIGDKGHNGFWYLDQMLRELRYIRSNMFNGGGSGKGKRKKGNTFIPNIEDYNIPKNYITDRDREDYEYRETRNEERYDYERGKLSEKYKLFNPEEYGYENLSKGLDYRLKDIKQVKNYENEIKERKSQSTFFKELMNDLDETGASYTRINSIIDKIKSVVDKPNQIISRVMNKVDDKLYSIIYGTGEKEDDRGFMSVMVEKLQNTFTDFSIWLDEKIIDPLSDKIKSWNIKDKMDSILEKTGLKDLGKSLKTYLFGDKETGTDGLFSEIGRGVKSTFKGAWGTTKNAFSNVFSPITGSLKGRFSGLNVGEDRAAQNFSQNIGDVVNKYINNNVPHMAKGGDVEDTGLHVLSKGEKVVPKEEVGMYNNFKNFIKSSVNGINTGKDSNESIANRLHLKMKNALRGKEQGSDEYNSILSNMLGMLNHDKTKELFDSEDKNKQYAGILDAVLKELENPSQVKNGATNFIINMGNEMSSAASKIYSRYVHGEEQVSDDQMKKDKEKVGNYIASASKTISTYAPEAVGSALLGSGVSLLTGMVGGPLLGAAVGAGISITKHSETMQKMLFGEEVEDENGNKQRKGGLLAKATSQKFIDKLKKFGPHMKDYGIVGGVAGLIPFMPFGPITGIMLGSAFGYAKESGKLQEWLFGKDNEQTWLGKSKDKFKNALPRMGAGALIAATVGPFGLLGNAAVGTAIGFATTSDRFQQAIFGMPDGNGKYIGGLLPTFKEKIIDPMGDFLKKKGKDAVEWFKKKVFDPLASSVKPFGKQLEVMAKGLGKGILNIFDRIIEHRLGVPLSKLIVQIGAPLGKAVTKVAGTLAKFTIGVPVSMIGSAGNALRKHQIKVGTADYMSASERLQYRRSHMMGLGDKFSEFDQLLDQAGQGNIENLNQIKDSLSGIRSDYKATKSNRTMKIEEMGGVVSRDLGYFTSRTIMKLIKDGKVDQALAMIDSTNQIDDFTKNRLKKQLSSKINDYQNYNQQSLNNSENYYNLINQLKKSGVKIPNNILRNPDKLSKYIDLVDKEINVTKKRNELKSPEEKMVELQEKEEKNASTFREKVRDGIEKITSLLHDIAHPSPNTKNAMDAFYKYGAKRKIEKTEDGRLYYKNGQGEMVYVNSKGDPIQYQENEVEDANSASEIPSKFISNPNKKKSRNNRSMRDNEGREYTVDGNNNIIYNKGDTETQQALKEDKENETFKEKIVNYISGKAAKGKDVVSAVSGLAAGGADKGNGVKDIFTKMLGVGMALSFAPQIFNFIKSTVYPWFRDRVVPFFTNTIAPAIGNAVGSMVVPALKGLGSILLGAIGGLGKGLYNSTLGKLFGQAGDKTVSNQTKDNNGNTVTTYSDGSVVTTDKSGAVISSIPASGNVARSDTNPFGNVPSSAYRYVLTGGRTGTTALKGIGWLAEKGGKVLGRATNIAGSVLHPIKTLFHPIKALTGRNETIVGKALTKGGSLLKGSTETLQKMGAFANKAYSGLDKKIMGSVIGKKVAGAAIANNIVANVATQKLTESTSNFLMKLINNEAVQSLIGSDVCKAISRQMVKFTEKLGEGLAKSAAKISGRMLALATTGGLLNIAFAVADFISGYNNAQVTLGITDEPSFSQKVICGLIKALTGFSIVLSVIPDDFWVDLLYDTIMPALGFSDKSLQDERAKAREQLDEYNKQNNTNLTMEQFINRNKKQGPSGWKGITTPKYTPPSKAQQQSSSVYKNADAASSKSNIMNDYQGVKTSNNKNNSNPYAYVPDNTSTDTSNSSDTNSTSTAPQQKTLAQMKSGSINDVLGNKGGPNNKYSDYLMNMHRRVYGGVGGTNDDFLASIVPGAEETYKEYGIFPSVTIAQAINESGWGKSSAAQNDKNLFGIKFPGNHDPNLQISQGSGATDDGGNYTAYQSWADSIKDHGYFLKNNSIYSQAGVFNAKTPEEQIQDIKNAGYASAPDYVSTTMQIIKDNNLTQYDNGATYTGPGTASSGGNSSASQPAGIADFFTSLGSAVSGAVNAAYGFNKTNGSKSSNISTSATGNAGQLLQIAQQFLGSPYVWGGSNPPTKDASGNWSGGGFDCSGFVQYVYKQIGIDLPRTTYDQVKVGTAINDQSQLQPGDLVFFGSASAPHHVGLYMGNDQYIHAPKTGDVIKISKLSDRTDFCGGRRILGISTATGGPNFTFKGLGGPKFKTNFNGKGGVGDFFSNSLNGNVTSGFGYRNTTGNIPKNHTGIDIGAAKGTSIKSPIGGTVIANKPTRNTNGFGNLLVVKDGMGGEHYFGHMNNVSSLKPGDTINPGDSIGNIGSTGNSTGPHLHYETRANGIPVNPDDYIRKTFEIQQNMGGSDNYTIDNNDNSSNNINNNLDYTKFLQNVINLLAKICSNTDQLSKIVEILSGDSNSSNNSSSNNQSSSNAKQQLLNKIQNATASNQDLSMNDLMSQMEQLAKGL